MATTMKDVLANTQLADKSDGKKNSEHLSVSLQPLMQEQLKNRLQSVFCLFLTEAFYGKGKGNLSCFYKFFIKICELSQTTFYRFTDLPIKYSKDHFITLQFY